MDERSRKVNELLMNEEFLDKLGTCEDDQSVVALFNSEGIDMTVEEIEEISRKSAEVAKAATDGELKEEELETVAGGFVISFTTTALLLLATAELGFFAQYGYRTMKDDPTVKKIVNKLKSKYGKGMTKALKKLGL